MKQWARWVLIASVALVIGATCAAEYARLATPYYTATASLIARFHPWKIVDVRVIDDRASQGTILRLVGQVRRHPDDARPAAIVVGHVQVGEIIETPLVFWSLVLGWPCLTMRRYVWRIGLAVPLFLGLEVATTTCQLLYPLAEASSLLAGNPDGSSLAEAWSRFLEAGGRFALEVTGALLVAASGSSGHPHARFRRPLFSAPPTADPPPGPIPPNSRDLRIEVGCVEQSAHASTLRFSTGGV